MMSDEPPALMNGRGTPVTGMSATTTPMLMNAWKQSQAVMPAASPRCCGNHFSALPTHVPYTQPAPRPAITAAT